MNFKAKFAIMSHEAAALALHDREIDKNAW